ncbi:MAG: three-Cys-motif partner protein TcmP [Bacteroidales bacterium]|nr:three-Cys-motif partner protein TcmP [Bacteroidales bacterium]MBQ5872821.1 three-Cys-motif partner protein TcmP [Bacteroidales bacterium]
MKHTKDNVKNTLQIHSQAKVEFYKTYLERYLRILCLSEYINHINIYDVFCGMGIYEDGGKGSPIVAFDSIRNYYFECKNLGRNINTSISLKVNDIEKDKIDKVKSYIDEKNHNYCKVSYFNQDVNEMYKIVLNEIKTTPSNTRNLIFIDPYGYKNIDKQLLFTLMGNGKTEIILFLPISHMYRFTSIAINDENLKSQYEPLRNFVNSFFSDVNHPIRTNKINNVIDYIKYITTALRNNNKYFSTSYYIERDKTNHFALFFISSHILGYEKILDVKWELDEETGRGFKMPNPQGNLFADIDAEEIQNQNFKRLEEAITKKLQLNPMTNKELYEFVLLQEYKCKHANEVLSKMQNEDKIVVTDIKTGEKARKNSFYIKYKYYRADSPRIKISLK